MYYPKCVAVVFCLMCTLNVLAVKSDYNYAGALSTVSISPYAYDNSSQIFIISKSDDTVTDPEISISGKVNRAGIIKLEINRVSVCDTKIVQGGTFSLNGMLLPGRNDVNLYFTDSFGMVTRKTFNYVFLQSYDMVVDKLYYGNNGNLIDGHRVYNSIGAALQAAVPGTVIFVKNGSYNERVIVSGKDISIIGQDSLKTKIFYSVASKDTNSMTERNCMKINASADNFSLENLTVENSYEYKNGSGEQADAVCVLADRAVFSNVRFVSLQDTLLADSLSSSVIARQYFYKCFITGNVDFIYGRGRSYFHDCDIVGRYTPYKKDGCFTAPRTDISSRYGFVFSNCRFTVENGITDGSYRLGRPWGADAAMAVVNCYMGPCVVNTAYSDMSGNLYKNARFCEYRSFGRGAAINSDRPQIPEYTISEYTAENVFADGIKNKFDFEERMDKMYIDSSEPVTTHQTTTVSAVTTSSHTVTTTGAPETTYEEVKKVIYGDVNNNSNVDITDLTILSQYLLQDVSFDQNQLYAADVTGDGDVNLGDLAHLKQYIMKENIILGPDMYPKVQGDRKALQKPQEFS